MCIYEWTLVSRSLLFLRKVTKNSPIVFPKLSEHITPMLDNVSWCRSQLSAQITQHETEGDHRENREIQFGDSIGDFLYGSVCGISLTFFTIIGCRIIECVPDLCQNVASNAPYRFPLKTENWYFLTKSLHISFTPEKLQKKKF